MKKEEFYNRFIKVIRPEHNVFKPLTKELMIENGLLNEFIECVEKGIFTPIKETDKYFINWDLFKSYIKDQSSNTANENTTKLIADMVKEIADSKKQVRIQAKEIADLKEQVRRLQNELNAKETKDEVEEFIEKYGEEDLRYNVKLFDLDMTPQQRKVATYLQEILKWNNQTSFPSNIQISRDCKISVNSITQIIKDLKIQILHQDEITGNWYITMPSKSNILTPVNDTEFKNGTFQYVKVDIDIFTNLSAELLETYVRMVSLASYMKSNKSFTPSWVTLSSSWNINKETLRKRAYKLQQLNLIDWNNNENSYISNISVKTKTVA